MKQVHANYTFVASTKTITLTGLNIAQDQLLLITNATRGIIYYNFASSSHRAVVTAGANTTVVLTDASTTGHGDSDQLVIHYDDQLSTQTIAGTVTANLSQESFRSNPAYAYEWAIPIGYNAGEDSVGKVNFYDFGITNGPLPVRNGSDGDNPIPLAISGTVTVGNTVTVAGTVTANPTGTQTIAGTVTANSAEVVSIVNTTTVTKADAKFSLIAGANNPTDAAQSYSITPLDVDIKGVAFVDGKVVSHRSSCVAELTGQGGPAWKATLVASSVTVGNSVTIGSLPAISGTVTANVGNVSDIVGVGYAHFAELLSNEPIFIARDNSNDLTALKTDASKNLLISGTVTVGAMPNGALTTRFGTPTTANTAFATSAVTNTSRKYLLIQNVTTGSNVITVGIGFTPTTTQGIQLTAGAGITFESSYIPTGAVYVLSSVTASNFTVLEA